MAETKKGRLFDLPETKGTFQVRGLVSGTKKDKFFKEITTKSQRPMRIVKFGVNYNEGENGTKTIFVDLQGMEQDNVYFSKRAEKKGEKGDTVKVPWIDRFSYNREGYRLIGKNIGVKKIVDEKGNLVNDKKVLTDFDACKEIAENLKDGNSVFIRGNLDYSSFTDDKNKNKRTFTKLVPAQVSLCGEVKFDDKNYVPKNHFEQTIIFMGIDPEKTDDEKLTGRYVVLAKIVTYSNIEDIEMIIEKKELAQKFKKALKPYYAINVHGDIVSSVKTEEVTEDDDEWGEKNPMKTTSAPFKTEFVITGATGSSIDKELYSQEKIEDAIVKINKANKAEDDFGEDSGEWGNSSDMDDDEEAGW